MKPKSLSVTEVVRNFSEYIGRVNYRHERFILIKGKRPVAELRPTSAGLRLGDLPELFASLPKLADDDADIFAGDISKSRQGLPRAGTRDPWASC